MRLAERGDGAAVDSIEIRAVLLDEPHSVQFSGGFGSIALQPET
jgi:hypothetical protein